MKQRFRKNDISFMGILFSIALVLVLVFYVFAGSDGGSVKISVNGELYGTYSLDKDQTVPIIIGETTSNVLEIKNKKADMVEADCPDKLCVKQKAIHKTGETIVCLPNKVVAEVIGGEENSLDSVVK